MPSFAISKFTVLLEPLWVSAEFLLLSTDPYYSTKPAAGHQIFLNPGSIFVEVGAGIVDNGEQRLSISTDTCII